MLEGKQSTEKVTQCWKVNTAQRMLNAVLEGKHSTKKVTQCWKVNTVLEGKHSTEKVNTVLKGKRSTEKVKRSAER